MAERLDPLGLQAGGAGAGMSDRLLLVTVAAMAFLAALALAGAMAASGLAAHWRADSKTALTVQVIAPDDAAVSGGVTRLNAVTEILAAMPDVTGARRLSSAEVNALLRPWLGGDPASLALTVPAVITGSFTGGAPDALRARLNAAAPGTLVETGAAWSARVAALTASIEACAAAALLIVAAVAAAIIAVATRAGLAQRRETIEIIHGLGALDADIAARFAGHITKLAATGALIGTTLALPVLFWLWYLAAPFGGGLLPAAIWGVLPALPIIAALIGWGTTRLTVQGWLRGLA